MKFILCANHRAGYEALISLLSEKFCCKDSLIVFTHNNIESEAISKECINQGIDYYFESINNVENIVAAFEPDIILSCYYRLILNKSILSIPSLGSFNIHPSLLPYYKGTFSTPWAIINNEKYTGVSFHEMTENVDMGKLISQERLRIHKNDTAFTLYHRLVSLAIRMLPETLNLIFSGYRGSLQKNVNDNSKSYYPRKIPYDGILSMSEITYEQACLFVRAMYFPPFKGAQFILKDGSIREIQFIEDLSTFKKDFCMPEIKK